MQLILQWFLHSSLPSQDSSVIPSARCTWAKLLSRTCTRLLCNLHKPHQWQPLSHSISPQISNLLSCKHTGQIASKDDVPRSSYFILLPRILGQTIYVEKTYEFLLLSPPETFSIALYHIRQHWYLGGNLQQPSFSVLFGCRSSVQTTSHLPGLLLSPWWLYPIVPSSRHPGHAFLHALLPACIIAGLRSHPLVCTLLLLSEAGLHS